MPVLIPRIRTVGVRLSEQEYSELERFCLENRARSISDVARAALCQFLHQQTGKDPAAAAVAEQTAQLRELEGKLERLTAEFDRLKARSGDDADGEGGENRDEHEGQV